MQVEEAALRRTVSKNIAAYRKAHKDTQMDLAAKLNYSDKSISKWERGESLPDIYILTRIADLYGITVSNPNSLDEKGLSSRLSPLNKHSVQQKSPRSHRLRGFSYAT